MVKTLHVKALFWIAVGTWAFMLFTSGVPITVALLKPSGMALGVVTGAIAVFEKYAWRWKVIRPWFVSTPDLVGTYRGTIRSFWTDPQTGQHPAPIDAYLSVHQTLSSMTVRLFTRESASVSLAASLADSPDERWDLVFTYRNEPKLPLQERSRIHHGGARMTVDGKGHARLSGSYWTDRNTFGELEFSRISRSRSCTFTEAEEADAGSR